LNIKTLYKAAKHFVDAYEHEQRHQSQAVPVNWSGEKQKQRAYGKLLDCAIGRMSRETICDAAIELAETCKPEDKPKIGDVYRDVFGKKLVIAEIDSMNYGNRKNVIFYNKEDERKLPLEEFIRCFRRCDRD